MGLRLIQSESFTLNWMFNVKRVIIATIAATAAVVVVIAVVVAR